MTTNNILVKRAEGLSETDNLSKCTKRDYLSESKKTEKDKYTIVINGKLKVLNAKEIIKLSRANLCLNSNENIRNTWTEVVKQINKINNKLAECCVPECIYRGWCYEHESCNLHKKKKYRITLNEYRNNINGYGGNDIK